MVAKMIAPEASKDGSNTSKFPFDENRFNSSLGMISERGKEEPTRVWLDDSDCSGLKHLLHFLSQSPVFCLKLKETMTTV